MRKKLLNMCLMTFLMVIGTSAYALDKVNDVYQIGSAADFAEFAALVNGGEKGANAILTADIDLGTDIDTYKIYNGEYVGNKTHKVVLYDNVLGYHNEDEDPDGISTIDFNDNVNVNLNNGGIYNLSGQRLSRLQKGLNIINGKKIVVK